MRKAPFIIAAAVLAVATAMALRRAPEAPGRATEIGGSAAIGKIHEIAPGPADPESAPEEPMMAEEDEDAFVDAFDALTDRWTAPTEGGVSVDDMEAFVERFRRVPQRRRNECLQRAVNLIPEENAMLIAGILMDRTQDGAIARSALAYVLNLDESVKNPIMKMIFEDRSHPCNDDVRWIFEVTGEMPEEN